jgi:PAS domain S-box-containing protein
MAEPAVVPRDPDREECVSQPDIELRRIVDLTPQMLAVMEPDGHISWLNQVALDYLGISLADLSGRDLRALVVHPDDLQPIRHTRQHALATGVPYHSELRVRDKDGHYRWFFIRYAPLKDAEQRIVRWYGGAIDIEDRKRAEAARRRCEAYLAEAQRLTHTLWVNRNPGPGATFRFTLPLRSNGPG